MSVRKVLLASVLALSTAIGPVSAETIQGALAKAYKFNSSLNYGRAGLRATDENVPYAKSGYRPVIVGTGSLNYSNTRSRSAGSPTSGLQGLRTVRGDRSTRVTTTSFGIQINQMIFDGFQTRNNVRSAEASVLASRENLRNTEQNTLYNAAAAYMAVIRDRRIAKLTEQNLAFLDEQVRSAKSRFDVGEGTRTDVAQAEGDRASAVASLADARSNVLISAATYRQVIGDEPGKLSAAKTLAKMLPKSLSSAQAIAEEEHPAILAYEHSIDAAGFNVKAAEGALLPSLDATGTVQRNYTNSEGGGWSNEDDTSASIGAQLTIPIYQGGAVSATIRQNKELLGQARIQLDVSRDSVRQTLASNWASYAAAREGVEANRAVVAAARLALNGVIEERNVGQRTTYDVLQSQQDVINAEINLANDEYSVVVASYAILNAMGRLTAPKLGLAVAEYKPKEHYDAVKDKWMGLRTPDGR